MDTEITYNPKDYFFNNRYLRWTENISKNRMFSMDNGEMFILLDKDGDFYSEVLKDSYGKIRERLI